MSDDRNDNVIEGQFEVTDESIKGFIENGQAPTYHSILEVWRETLRPAEAEKDERVGPSWANRIVSSYAGMTYGLMNAYRNLYFNRILELLNILLLEIEEDPDALDVLTPEEDVERNGHHYRNLVLQWNLAILSWELDWDCTSETAAAELASISEVHKMFFGQTGITQFLDNIRLEFSEDDQQMLTEALQEHKAGR